MYRSGDSTSLTEQLGFQEIERTNLGSLALGRVANPRSFDQLRLSIACLPQERTGVNGTSLILRWNPSGIRKLLILKVICRAKSWSLARCPPWVIALQRRECVEITSCLLQQSRFLVIR